MKRFVAAFVMMALLAVPLTVWAVSKSQTFQVSVYIPPIPGVNDQLAKNDSTPSTPLLQQKESQDSVTFEETTWGAETLTLKSVTIK